MSSSSVAGGVRSRCALTWATCSTQSMPCETTLASGYLPRNTAQRRAYYFGFSQKFGPGAAAQGKPIEKTPPTTQSSYRNSVMQRVTKQDPSLAVWTWTGFYLGA